MSKRDTLMGIVVALVIILPIGGAGYGIGYEWSASWSDTGHVNWVGQKQFNANNFGSWSIPFSVNTTSHGLFNFTSTSTANAVATGNALLCDGSTITKYSNGTFLGIYKTNYGCVELVQDP